MTHSHRSPFDDPAATLAALNLLDASTRQPLESYARVLRALVDGLEAACESEAMWTRRGADLRAPSTSQDPPAPRRDSGEAVSVPTRAHCENRRISSSATNPDRGGEP